MVVDVGIGAPDLGSVAHESAAHKRESARLLRCARCGLQVLLCGRCDRGQRYCGRVCSAAARRDAQRGAARRYQSSPGGRAAHAARSRRWRIAHHADQGTAPSVTHQGGSAELATVHDVASALVGQGKELPPCSGRLEFRCAHCLGALALWVRQGLSRRARQRPRRSGPLSAAQAAGP